MNSGYELISLSIKQVKTEGALVVLNEAEIICNSKTLNWIVNGRIFFIVL